MKCPMSKATVTVCTPTIPSADPMRGFGMPEMHSGLEQCIDELARQIGMDAVEFRMLNCLKTGSILATGGRMHPIGLDRVH